MSLAENLKRIRLQRQMTQPKLAEDAHVSKGYVYMLETGEMDNPSLDVLLKIANALDCTIADLSGEPKVVAKDTSTEISESLLQFAKQKRRTGDKLTDDDLQSLARTQFRGKRPQTVDDWAYLYEFLKRTFED